MIAINVKSFVLTPVAAALICSIASPTIAEVNYILPDGDDLINLSPQSSYSFGTMLLGFNNGGLKTSLTINGYGEPGSSERGDISVSQHIKVGNVTHSTGSGDASALNRHGFNRHL